MVQSGVVTGGPAVEGFVFSVEHAPEVFEQGGDAPAGGSGHGQEGDIRPEAKFSPEVADDLVEVFIIYKEVGLVEDDDFGLFSQVCRVGFELVADEPIVFSRGALVGQRVDQVDDRTGSLGMAEEVVPEPGPLGSALDEPRNICENNPANLVENGDADIGRERRKWVIRDFRGRTGEAAEQGGLAGIGQAHEPDIGDEFEFEAEEELLTGLAFGGFSGCLIGGTFEMLVAVAAFTALGDDDAVTGADVVEDFLGFFVEDDGARGYSDDQIGGGFSVLLLASALLAVLGTPEADTLEVDEGIEPGVCDEDDIATFAAIAAVGASLGQEWASMEGETAVAAVAGADLDDGAIYEHGARVRAGREPGAIFNLCLREWAQTSPDRKGGV